MQRLILFSQPTENNSIELFDKLFPKDLKEKVFAYMPSSGRNSKQQYTDYWKEVSTARGFEFLFIDNMQEGESANEEAQKLDNANVLLITGGNTFELLRNLKRSGLDEAIKNFRNKSENIIAGFSAGAIVLSPRIDVSGRPAGIDTTDAVDENLVGITDLRGLNIVDFEIFPHYYEEKDKVILENYRKVSPYEVKTLSDDDLLIIDK
jgi:dipeptidase E